MANLRGSTLIHNAAALGTGAATTKYAYVGSATNVVIYIVSDTSTTVAVQTAMKSDGVTSAGLNTDLSAATWCFYAGSDAISITGGHPFCFDVSPFAPQYIRLWNLSSGSPITTLTCMIEANG